MQMLTKRISPGVLFSLISLLPFTTAHAEEAVCAVVKIEIQQEMTLERQAFDAQMRINNGLDTASLENVSINVTFKDADDNPVLASSDPDNTDALFFIHVNSMDGITDIDGTGVVAPNSAADIHWTIIPSIQAGGTAPSGTLYFVGASLSYLMGGEEKSMTVTPDSILVKPLPRLTLDYFLTKDVYADDAFTPELEPAEPFTLGVRVKNTGIATANAVAIDSAQPKIVENKQGLLISFTILGGSVDDKPAAPTLLVSLGDIASETAKVGRWDMVTTLSGQFTEFTANVSHADELGGQLTSLISAANTHFLLRDVRVDLPGRDAVRDFLALDGDTLRVYESNTVDTEVTDRSNGASMSAAGSSGEEVYYDLNQSPTAGFMYIKLPDPYHGDKGLLRVVRSDGKALPPENAWFSKTRNADQSWSHYFNLFDANSTGRYRLVFKDSPKPPVFGSVDGITTWETNPTTLLVTATDPNGTTPMLTAIALPTGAIFTDHGNGSGTLSWTPQEGQAGTHSATFQASDGALSATVSASIKVNPAWDTDGDGMDDDWEREFFGDLSRDGTGDLDGDGISDLQEYLDGTDPTHPPKPEDPTIIAPDDVEVTTLTPALLVSNSVHSPHFPVTYEFEVYTDASMAERIANVSGIAEGEETTAWDVKPALTDNTWYYWRVRATDGKYASEWVGSRFFVNLANDPPGEAQVRSPADDAWVDTFTPALSVTNSTDIDGDELRYTFELFADGDLGQPLVAVEGLTAGSVGYTEWVSGTALDENTYYQWRVTVTDEHDAVTEGPFARFFVNTANDAPSTPSIQWPAAGSEIGAMSLDLVVQNANDPEAEPLIYYFEVDTAATFDGPNKRQSGPVQPDVDITQWTVPDLQDNTWHYWRAKASDGRAESDWVQGHFFVNTANDPPSVPTPQNPGANAWVGTLMPPLSVYPANDVDGDTLHYEFEVYGSYLFGTLANKLASGTTETNYWQVDTALPESSWYYWRARAIDEHGLEGSWSAPVRFFADEDGVNDPPSITLKKLRYEKGGVSDNPSRNGMDTCEKDRDDHRRYWERRDERGHDNRGKRKDEDHGKDKEGDRHDDDRHREDAKQHKCAERQIIKVHWSDRDPDGDARIELYYDTDNRNANGVLIVDGLAEDPDGEGDVYYWDVSSVPAGIYYVYAVISDGNSSRLSYSPNTVVVGDGGNAPFIELDSPSYEDGKKNKRALISWRDFDADSSATIALYFDTAPDSTDGILIANGLSEDADGNHDKYLWDISALPPGSYYIYAVISDGNQQHVGYSPQPLVKGKRH